MNTPRIILAAVLLALCAHLPAAVVLELDASALPTGEITETKNPIPGARWHPNVPLRVETVKGRQAFVFDGTQQLISESLPVEKWDAFTVEAWVVNPAIDRLETVAAICSAKGGTGTDSIFPPAPARVHFVRASRRPRRS